MSKATSQRIVVFSGGSATNNLVDVFNTLIERKKCGLTYVIPISDNGGSSSELIRVFGGPGIGDVRSRLVRLIPSDGEQDVEKKAIRAFFNHRLPPDPDAAKREWLDIVEARHAIWQDISSEKRELVRSFLNFLNLEAVKRARPSSVFNFSSASVGNMFLTGARIFIGSFESAIHILSIICGVPQAVSVLPAINTNFTHHIAAGLTDGTQITGQNSISHPSGPTALAEGSINPGYDTEEHDSVEDANWPGSLPTLRKQYITFSKVEEEELPCRIERIWYINPYGQEIRLSANPKVIDAIKSSQWIVYSIGSLYTSIIPSIILRGVGEAVASNSIRQKILILNGTLDRETGPSSNPLTAFDFVAAIAKAAAESRGSNGDVPESDFKLYVTHVLYLDGPGTPEVDKKKLGAIGIESVRLYGRKMENGKGCKYDDIGLTQALEAIIGSQESKAIRSRRNTLEH